MNKLSGSPMKDACGPCLTEKQIRKSREQEAKDLKAVINYLVKSNGYESYVVQTVGSLMTRLFHLQGPLK